VHCQYDEDDLGSLHYFLVSHRLSLNIFTITFSKLKWLSPNNPSGNCWSLAIYLLTHSFKHVIQSNQVNLTLIAIYFLSYFTYCNICLCNQNDISLKFILEIKSFSSLCHDPHKPRVFNMTIDTTAFDCLLFFSFNSSFNSSLWESRVHHFSVETRKTANQQQDIVFWMKRKGKQKIFNKK